MPKPSSRALKVAFIFLSSTLGCLFAQNAKTLPETLSEPDAVAFARRMEQAMATNDSAFFRQHLDLEGILNRAVAGLSGLKEVEASFRKSFPTASTLMDLEQELTKTSCQLLRVHQEGAAPRALFRVTKPDGGIAYYDLILERSAKGTARITDVANLAAAELLGETARRHFLEELAGVKRGFFARLLEKEMPEVKAAADTAEFFRLAKAKKFPEVLAAYRLLPPALQNHKPVLLERCAAALAAADKEHSAALLAWQKDFPKDPAPHLLAAEFYRRNKNPQKTIEALAQLDEIIDDPRLNLLQAAQWQALEAWEKSAESARRALSRDATLHEAYAFIFASHLELLNYAEITQMLINLQVNTKTDGTQYFSKHRKYDRYTRSDAFQQWLQFLNPATAPPPAASGQSSLNKLGASAAAALVKKSGLKLQGIMFGGAKVSALINGKTLFIGEQIGLYVVRKIETGQVTLESSSGQEIVLTLKEIYAP